jgi:hypothetical protein
MTTVGLERPPTPPFLLASRRLSPGVLFVLTIFLGSALIGLARVDNAPGALATTGLLIAAWLPSALRLRRSWIVGLWMLWALCLGVFEIAWLIKQDVSAPHTRRGADGTQVSCWYSSGPLGIGRVVVYFGTAGMLAGLGALFTAYRRESLAPCHDSTEHLAVVAGAWLSFAGALTVVDAATLDNRSLFCDIAPVNRTVKDISRVNSAWPPECAPDQKDAPWTSRHCRVEPAPATRPLAIISGTLVFGLGAAGAFVVGAHIRRRRRWLEGWLPLVQSGKIHGWSLGAPLPIFGDDDRSNEQTVPWLARADEGAPDGFYRLLSYSTVFEQEVDNAGSSYRTSLASKSVEGVAVARIEQIFAADEPERIRRGERGARKVVLAVLAPGAIAIVGTIVFFIFVRLAC